MFDLITGREESGHCARSADYTFAGKLAMEIGRHVADKDWLELRLRESLQDPPPPIPG